MVYGIVVWSIQSSVPATKYTDFYPCRYVSDLLVVSDMNSRIRKEKCHRDGMLSTSVEGILQMHGFQRRWIGSWTNANDLS